ncbi:MAG: RNA polymerase factor sigma-54 [Burkholderiales bacterium]|nr:RNA polymerase factor sigma-54 [Burkholderiales bacterium]MDP2399204.1 RNA polymerase factor sigma-54 [Burkholderiales bacterium]
MKHSLQLRLSQHLTLTPQLQQSIRLLQLSTLELNQEIERLLQDNPLLEREDGTAETPPLANDASLQAVPGDTTTPDPEPEPTTTAEDGSTFDMQGGDGTSFGSGGNDEDEDYSPLAEQPANLREHLTGQLALLHLSDRDRQLVGLLIDSLDEGGYMTQSLEEIAAMLPDELEVEPEELSIALQHLQHLEPTGVGARSLAECLRLQLDALPPDTPYREQAQEIVREHLDALAARDFARLKRTLKCDDSCLRGVQKLILSLNPRPGREFSVEETRFVVSDVIVRKLKGVWVAALNPAAMPKLKVNRLYADILQRNRGSNSQQITAQLQEAKWLIKNVQQRFDTILRVSQAIVDRQRNFLEHGEVAMRPLVLREIADTLGLHESTVSRVTTQKFMHTPRGIFELKYFFGSHVATEAGGSASSTAIRALIKQLVGAENTRSPLSDGQISELLGQQGIVVARRTIAKYRESMHILPVNLRKTL